MSQKKKKTQWYEILTRVLLEHASRVSHLELAHKSVLITCGWPRRALELSQLLVKDGSGPTRTSLQYRLQQGVNSFEKQARRQVVAVVRPSFFSSKQPRQPVSPTSASQRPLKCGGGTQV